LQYGVINMRVRGPCHLLELFAGVSENYAAAMPFEQQMTEVSFKASKLPAQARLGEIEFLGRPRNRAAACDLRKRRSQQSIPVTTCSVHWSPLGWCRFGALNS
jgi:hypothetical protein